MLTNSQETPADGRYEAVIALMQTYDCSYEEAERHLQELGSFQEGEEMQPGGEL